MIGVERDRRRAIFELGLPIIGGMVSQTILNLVDTAMVGTLGDAAVAAVGIGSFANFVALAFILGLGTGVQAIAARRWGEGARERAAYPLNGGLLLAVAMAVPLTVVLFLLVPSVMPLLNENVEVQRLGGDYLRARLVGMVFVGANFCFRGYWNAVGLSRLYMRVLVLMHAADVAISYVLIFGVLGAPALGATGAGVGTTIAVGLGTAYYAFLARRHARAAGFLSGLPDRSLLAGVLRLSIPTGLQQLTFSAGFTALFWIIGRIGAGQSGAAEVAAANVAAANVLINIMLFAVLPGMGLGLAANSLVGHALGRGDAADARRWGWEVVKIGVAMMACLGVPMLLLPDVLLSAFLHNPRTLELARLPLQVVGLTMGVDAVGLVLQQALLGAGASRTVLVVSAGLQWGFFLPAAFVLGTTLGFGILGIWILQVVYRAMQAGIFAALWQRGRWATIAV